MAIGDKFPGAKNFGKTPGSRARNSPLLGQNLPAIFTPPAPGPLNPRDRSYGPAVLGLASDPEVVGGPGDPPVGFIGGTNSLSEWYFYWAMEKILGPEGINWVYQDPWMGGRQQQGGAVVDFVIRSRLGRRIGIRIQTYRFHFNTDAFQQARDEEQLRALHGPDFIVIDIFEQQFIDDDTGQAAISLVLEAWNERQRPNPLATGFVIGTG